MSDRFAKNSWTCCAAERVPRLLLPVLLCLFLLVGIVPAEAKKGKKGKKEPQQEELYNLLLGLEYSHWLVGPISWIATDDEREAYLLLTSDEEAEAFIDDFWAGRAGGLARFERTPRRIFEERVEEADKRFREGTLPGSSTDRGTVFVVFGEPEEIRFESSLDRGGLPAEIFRYGKDAEPGLGGEKPKREYRFVTLDGQTVFWTNRAQIRSRDPRRQRQPRF